jgi:Ca2+-binding RTX toxin-like protein
VDSAATLNLNDALGVAGSASSFIFTGRGDVDFEGGNTVGLNGTSVTFNTSGLTVDNNGFVVTGTAGADTITTGLGNDNITGGDGNDSISTGVGDDTLVGGNGVDALTGGNGADVITGGAGNDSIVLTDTDGAIDTVVIEATAALNGTDTISGFTLTGGADVIDFSITLADLRGTGAVAERLATGAALGANTGVVIASADIADAAAAELFAEGLTGEGAGDIIYLFGSTDADSATGITSLYRVDYTAAGDATVTKLAGFNAFVLNDFAAANLVDYAAIV